MRDLIREAVLGGRAEGRLWRCAVAVVVGFSSLVVGLYPIADAVYDARLARDAARTPLAWEDDSPPLSPGADDPRPWFNLTFAMSATDSIHVLSFAPPTADAAPPPPGLPRWPGPGEVFATRAVLDLPQGPEFARAYGTVVGVVDPATLADPGDRLLYVGLDRARLHPPGFWFPVHGFGAPVSESGDVGFLGGSLTQAPRESLWLGLTLFGLAPGLLLTGVVLRLGGDRRDRAVLVLRALGAGRSAIARAVVRMLVGPVLLGSMVGYLVVLAASTREWTMPLVSYTFAAADIRAGLPAAGQAVATFAALVLVAGVLLHLPRRRPTTGPNIVVHDARPRTRILWVALGAIVVANWAHVAFHESSPLIALYVRLVCAALVVGLLAPAAAPLVAWLARAVVAVARLTGSAGALVAGRDLARHSRAAVRVSTVASMLIVLGFQAQTLIAEGDLQVREAGRSYTANDGRVLQIEAVATADTAWVTAILAANEADFGVLVLGPRGDDIILAGHCHDLTTALTACPAREGGTVADLSLIRPELGLYGVAGDTRVVTLDGAEPGLGAPQQGDTILFVTRDGTPVDAPGVIARLAQEVHPVPVVAAVGQSSVVGAVEGAEPTEWITVGMLFATVLALSTALFALLLELVRSEVRVRSYFTWARRRDVVAFAAWSVGAPTLLAVVLGITAGVGLIASAAQDPASFTTVSAAGVGSIALAGLAASVAGTAVAAVVTGRMHARRAR